MLALTLRCGLWGAGFVLNAPEGGFGLDGHGFGLDGSSTALAQNYRPAEARCLRLAKRDKPGSRDCLDQAG